MKIVVGLLLLVHHWTMFGQELVVKNNKYFLEYQGKEVLTNHGTGYNLIVQYDGKIAVIDIVFCRVYDYEIADNQLLLTDSCGCAIASAGLRKHRPSVFLDSAFEKYLEKEQKAEMDQKVYIEALKLAIEKSKAADSLFDEFGDVELERLRIQNMEKVYVVDRPDAVEFFTTKGRFFRKKGYSIVFSVVSGDWNLAFLGPDEIDETAPDYEEAAVRQSLMLEIPSFETRELEWTFNRGDFVPAHHAFAVKDQMSGAIGIYSLKKDAFVQRSAERILCEMGNVLQIMAAKMGDKWLLLDSNHSIYKKEYELISYYIVSDLRRYLVRSKNELLLIDDKAKVIDHLGSITAELEKKLQLLKKEADESEMKLKQDSTLNLDELGYRLEKLRLSVQREASPFFIWRPELPANSGFVENLAINNCPYYPVLKGKKWEIRSMLTGRSVSNELFTSVFIGDDVGVQSSNYLIPRISHCFAWDETGKVHVFSKGNASIVLEGDSWQSIEVISSTLALVSKSGLSALISLKTGQMLYSEKSHFGVNVNTTRSETIVFGQSNYVEGMPMRTLQKHKTIDSVWVLRSEDTLLLFSTTSSKSFTFPAKEAKLNEKDEYYFLIEQNGKTIVIDPQKFEQVGELEGGLTFYKREKGQLFYWGQKEGKLYIKELGKDRSFVSDYYVFDNEFVNGVVNDRLLLKSKKPGYYNYRFFRFNTFALDSVFFAKPLVYDKYTQAYLTPSAFVVCENSKAKVTAKADSLVFVLGKEFYVFQNMYNRGSPFSYNYNFYSYDGMNSKFLKSYNNYMAATSITGDFGLDLVDKQNFVKSLLFLEGEGEWDVLMYFVGKGGLNLLKSKDIIKLSITKDSLFYQEGEKVYGLHFASGKDEWVDGFPAKPLCTVLFLAEGKCLVTDLVGKKLYFMADSSATTKILPIHFYKKWDGEQEMCDFSQSSNNGITKFWDMQTTIPDIKVEYCGEEFWLLSSSKRCFWFSLKEATLIELPQATLYQKFRDKLVFETKSGEFYSIHENFATLYKIFYETYKK